MKKFVCTVCGYVYEGETAPEKCPTCGVGADKFNYKKQMTYNYYQENKDDILKIELENGKTFYVCTICGYVYKGEELPEDFVCPICFASRELFEKKMK